ncbi:hypothetical protein ACIOEX_24840 [Streptomyces sp. NPDC087850]|uniref:hypothetical protein n=1 Tax=Streptomyces sp. NPDC087850 TaxID=3365809 RepID=UPI00381F982F
MRPTVRLLTSTALAVASLGLSAASATSAFASDWDQDREWDRDRDRDHSQDHGRNSWQRLELSPRTARPGAVVRVSTTVCGHEARGRGDARSVGAGEFRLEPEGRKGVASGQFWVPNDARPGSHDIRVRCDNGKQADADLFVEHPGPSGHVRTGVGGSVGSDTTQIAAGVAVLATAAVGGTWLLRRRASGAQES